MPRARSFASGSQLLAKLQEECKAPGFSDNADCFREGGGGGLGLGFSV